MTRSPDVVVIGGGIAGLATAWQLAQRGSRVLLLERERILASHSSGRNAAIWLPADDDATTPPLARRSATLLDDLTQGAWRSKTGALMTSARPDRLDGFCRGAERAGLEPTRVGVDGIVAHAPALAGGDQRHGVWLAGAAELDIHLMITSIAKAARSAGAELRTGAGVAKLVREGERVSGVILEDGTRVAAGTCVIAGGAWAGVLAASADVPLRFSPLRRHLVQLQAAPGVAGTTVWTVDDEAYYRPQSDGVLASPCDEDPQPPGLPPAEARATETLAAKLARFAPGLAEARVVRSWACLRTFASDRELVAGLDSRVAGLGWLAGLGGRGMTVAAAAAELTAASVLGEVPGDPVCALAAVTKSERLYAS